MSLLLTRAAPPHLLHSQRYKLTDVVKAARLRWHNNLQRFEDRKCRAPRPPPEVQKVGVRGRSQQGAAVVAGMPRTLSAPPPCAQLHPPRLTADHPPGALICTLERPATAEDARAPPLVTLHAHCSGEGAPVASRRPARSSRTPPASAWRST